MSQRTAGPSNFEFHPGLPKARVLPRLNPFRSSRIESLPFRFTGEQSLDQLIVNFAGLDYRGALVGPKGSGKTTLLERLQAELGKQGLQVMALHRRPGEPPLPSLKGFELADTLITVDGAEQLGLWERLKLERQSKAGKGLLVTCHQPLGWIPILYLHRTDARLFISLTHELLARDQLSCPWSEDQLEKVFHRHQGNIRESFRELFDRLA